MKTIQLVTALSALLASMAFLPQNSVEMNPNLVEVSGNYRGKTTLFASKSAFLVANRYDSRLSLLILDSKNSRAKKRITIDFMDTWVVIDSIAYRAPKLAAFQAGESQGLDVFRDTAKGTEMFRMTFSDDYFSIQHQLGTGKNAKIISRTAVSR